MPNFRTILRIPHSTKKNLPQNITTLLRKSSDLFKVYPRFKSWKAGYLLGFYCSRWTTPSQFIWPKHFFNLVYANSKMYFYFLMSMSRKSTFESIPSGIYLFKANNGNARRMCEVCLKLIIKTPEWGQLMSFWCLKC